MCQLYKKNYFMIDLDLCIAQLFDQKWKAEILQQSFDLLVSYENTFYMEIVYNWEHTLKYILRICHIWSNHFFHTYVTGVAKSLKILEGGGEAIGFTYLPPIFTVILWLEISKVLYEEFSLYDSIINLNRNLEIKSSVTFSY